MIVSVVSGQVQSSIKIMYRIDFSPPKQGANLPNPGSNHGLYSFTEGLTTSKRASVQDEDSPPLGKFLYPTTAMYKRRGSIGKLLRTV